MSTNPDATPTPLARAAAQVALVSGAVFVALLAALHLVRTDVVPSWQFISDYEVGAHGWLMRAAFFSLALACAALVTAMAPSIRTRGGFVGLVLLALSGVGMAVAGVFTPDARGSATPSASARLHEIGAMLDFVPYAAPLLAWSLTRDPRWQARRRRIRTIAFLPLLGTAVFVGFLAALAPPDGVLPSPDAPLGWANRFMIVAHCGWLIVTARHVLLTCARQAPEPAVLSRPVIGEAVRS